MHAVKPDGLPNDHAPSVSEFPTAGWTSDKSKFPEITTTTILEHLVNSGKSVSSDKEGDGIVIAKRPLDRANELFFCGYVEDVWIQLRFREASVGNLWKENPWPLERLFVHWGTQQWSSLHF